MAKDPTKPNGAAETPPMPVTPLLPPVPSMLKSPAPAPTATAKRELVDAFKPESREHREARQLAKLTLQDCSNVLTQVQAAQARLSQLVNRPDDAAIYEKEGLSMDAVKRLNKAFLSVLDEFMPVQN